MTTSFEQWVKDPLFIIGEQVQESADKLESMHRSWNSLCRLAASGEYANRADLDFCRRQLKTALSTAKWQLEELERAANSSQYYIINNAHESPRKASQRRKQFIDIIRNQITGIETQLMQTGDHSIQDFVRININSKKTETLDDDDLARFLGCSTSGSATKIRAQPIITKSQHNNDNHNVDVESATDDHDEPVCSFEEFQRRLKPIRTRQSMATTTSCSNPSSNLINKDNYIINYTRSSSSSSALMAPIKCIYQTRPLMPILILLALFGVMFLVLVIMINYTQLIKQSYIESH